MAKNKRFRCSLCEHIYDPAEGDATNNIPPATPFEKLPDAWCCPDCGAEKSDHEPLDD